jgi:ribonuclease PH
MKRVDGRAWDELRPVKITLGYQSFAEGSALIELGKTRVLCSVRKSSASSGARSGPSPT